MKVSLIAAVYKDTQALDVIIKALRKQTYKNFEFIIAEDGSSKEMQEYLTTVKNVEFKIIHTTQEDNGIRKSKSQNNAIRASTGEYLIFIDGDCIPYSTFIEYHVKLAERGCFVGGKRVNLGPQFSYQMREGQLHPYELEKNFLWNFLAISNDAVERHTEEGFSVSPNSLIYKLFLKGRKKKLQLVGCNFSCFKKDMLAINGFNEELEDAAVASDTDIQWRFEAIGLKVKSAKYIANQFHLYHKRSSEQDRGNTALYLKNKQDKRYIADKGIVSHGE